MNENNILRVLSKSIINFRQIKHHNTQNIDEIYFKIFIKSVLLSNYLQKQLFFYYD